MMQKVFDEKRLRADERIAMTLRSIYESYGYTPYKMSKFEEYELYSNNIDFLGEGGVLTFTGVNGRLMALKPDVTLSIVKNFKGSSGTQKVYYKENVYRCAGRGESFKELPQCGIECIGDVGSYETSEILFLAVKSLEVTERPFKLEISHMGVLASLIPDILSAQRIKDELFTCIKRKNTDGIKELAKTYGAEESDCSPLCEAIALNGSAMEVIASLKRLCPTEGLSAVRELEEAVSFLIDLGYKDNIGIDLSILNDMNYYRSLVFRGYIDCIPDGILSGGRYDDLVKKMGRDCKAIGFALSLNKLEELSRNESPDIIDAVVLYDKNTPAVTVFNCCQNLRDDGLYVVALPSYSENLGGRRIFDLTADGVITERLVK